MYSTTIQVGESNLPLYSLNTVVVGTGASGLNAADCLYNEGSRDIAIVTEGLSVGTSRNTGSDKQTYYKLSLSGDDSDSVREMAHTLYSGQCVDGDVALCEAALSAKSFLKLTELGVEFPQNRYGEFIGYKTDHDPRKRATSLGPYTSKRMTEELEASVISKKIRIFDKMQVVRILSDEKKVHGLLCLDLSNEEPRFVLFNCKNIIFATGGPAGIYSDSVFPVGHHGASGIAFEAGAVGNNLTEWQFGLASIAPRWNVSGTFMQVLPRFVSTEADGRDEREFLLDFFPDKGDMLTKVFLKGYQWPFDVSKVEGGSSVIDLLVYIETGKGRRVFLDFQQNPGLVNVDFSSLSSEARDYLENGGACFGTPIQRLSYMNMPAIDFYKDKGVDITSEPLEIALCAQHNNGGIGVNYWWQSNLEGFFVVGEAAATHGVYRPGGSALNSGQVGSARAARYVAAKRTGEAANTNDFISSVEPMINEIVSLSKNIDGNENNAAELLKESATLMSRHGGAIRNADNISALAKKIKEAISNFESNVKTTNTVGLSMAFRLRDALIGQFVYLKAMEDYINNGGKSRGSALYTDMSGKKPYPKLPDVFTFVLDGGSGGDFVQETKYSDSECISTWRTVRPMPDDDIFFENVWREFRNNKNIW